METEHLDSYLGRNGPKSDSIGMLEELNLILKDWIALSRSKWAEERILWKECIEWNDLMIELEPETKI